MVIILGLQDPEDGGTEVLQNVRNYSPNNTHSIISQRTHIFRNTLKM
jgi:hypothetical protein